MCTIVYCIFVYTLTTETQFLFPTSVLKVYSNRPLLDCLTYPLHPARCHGSLGAGAVPQLHDRLNHCAADVAAGENLPGLKN